MDCPAIRNNPNSIRLSGSDQTGRDAAKDQDRFGQIVANGGNVTALVCEPGQLSPNSTTLFTYSGPGQEWRASEAGRQLTAAIQARLFTRLETAPLEPSFWEDQVELEDSWIPFNNTVLIDLSSTGLSGAERGEKISLFLDKLWLSGLISSPKRELQDKIDRYAARLNSPVPMFRDSKLQSYNHLASLYLQIGEYDRAREYAQRLFDFNLSVTTGRPIEYNETLVLASDALLLQALENNDQNLIKQAMTNLTAGLNSLGDDQYGEKGGLSLQMLRICHFYARYFRRAEERSFITGCEPGKANEYAQAATERYNQRGEQNQYADNFLAVKALLEQAGYLAATAQNPDEMATAIDGFNGVISAINKIGPENPIAAGLLRAYNRTIEVVSDKIGILRGWAYGDREYANFALFRARAWRGIGLAEIRLARRLDREQAAQHFQRAIGQLQWALTTTLELKGRQIYTFHTGASFEVRQEYHEVLSDYLEAILGYYYATDDRTALDAAAELLAGHSLLTIGSDDPINPSYLRAALTLAGFYKQRAFLTGDDSLFLQAGDLYDLIDRNIAAADPKQITAYHRYLNGQAALGQVDLFVAQPQQKSNGDIIDNLLRLRTGITLIAQSTIAPSDKKYLINTARLAEAELLLMQAARVARLEAAPYLAQAEEIYTDLLTGPDGMTGAAEERIFWYKAQAGLLGIAVRRSDFIQFTIDRSEVEKMFGKQNNGWTVYFQDPEAGTLVFLPEFLVLTSPINDRYKAKINANPPLKPSPEEESVHQLFAAFTNFQVGKGGETPKVRKMSAGSNVSELLAIFGPLHQDAPAFLRPAFASLLSTLLVYRAESGDLERVAQLARETENYAAQLPPGANRFYLTAQAQLQGKTATLFQQLARLKTITTAGEEFIAALKNTAGSFERMAQTLSQPETANYADCLNWDLASFKAEFYHQMAISFSMVAQTEADKNFVAARENREKTFLNHLKLYDALQQAYWNSFQVSDRASYDRIDRVALLEAAFGQNIPCAYDPENLDPVRPRYLAYRPFNKESHYLIDKNTVPAWQSWQSLFIHSNNLVKDFTPGDPKKTYTDSYVTERTGYGMFLASALDDRATVLALFNGVQQAIKQDDPGGLFAWRLKKDGTIAEKSSATDADIYIAYSLGLSGANPVETQRLIDKIWDREIAERGGRLLLVPSDEINGEWPRKGTGEIVYNPSYFAPHLLKFLAEIDTGDHPWDRLIDDNYILLDQALDTRELNPTAPLLLPDFMSVQMVGGAFVLKPDKSNNGYDAVRVALEIGRDAVINQDERAGGFLRKLVLKARPFLLSPQTVPPLAGDSDNLLAVATYAVALKGADPQDPQIAVFRQHLDAAYRQGVWTDPETGEKKPVHYYGYSIIDAGKYFKQSVIQMARLLLG